MEIKEYDFKADLPNYKYPNLSLLKKYGKEAEFDIYKRELEKPSIVSMLDIIDSKKFQECDMDLPVILGKTISNEVYIEDLNKMQNLLIEGATGQGKSVAVNALIASLLYKKHPSDLKFVFIDNEKGELNLYGSIEKHFLAKLSNETEAIVTDNNKVIKTLNSLCIEMDNRYELLRTSRVRTLKEYNATINPENGNKYLPYIVVVINEFADLIMTAGEKIESPFAHISMLGRSVGIHFVITTQRPIINFLTDYIEAHFAALLESKVIQKKDLDVCSADQFISKGDMLFTKGGLSTKIQCPFLDTIEVETIIKFISSQQGYSDAYLLPDVID